MFDYEQRGDIDGDGDFDNFDIQPFEALLTSNAPVAVPEPSCFLLAGLGLLILKAFQKRDPAQNGVSNTTGEATGRSPYV